MRAVRSSVTDRGVLEVVWELRDSELAEGDKTAGATVVVEGGGGGARFLPLPSTRPPPRLRWGGMTVRSYLFGPGHDLGEEECDLGV